MTYQKIGIIYNINSGKGLTPIYAQKIATYLEQENLAKDIILCQTKKGADSRNAAKSACDQGCDLIVAMGGDGTLGQIITGILASSNEASLAIIPLGTVNNLARSLEIPINPDQAMRLIGTGEKRAIDLGRVNDHYMISSLTLGYLAQSANRVTSQAKRKWGFLAFVFSLIRICKTFRSSKLELLHDHGRIQGRMRIVLIALTDSLGGIRDFVPEAQIYPGYFHILCLPEPSKSKSSRIFASLRREKASQNPNYHYFHSKSIVISQTDHGHRHRVRIDGDAGPRLPLRLEIVPHALNVLIPRKD